MPQNDAPRLTIDDRPADGLDQFEEAYRDMRRASNVEDSDDTTLVTKADMCRLELGVEGDEYVAQIVEVNLAHAAVANLLSEPVRQDEYWVTIDDTPESRHEVRLEALTRACEEFLRSEPADISYER